MQEKISIIVPCYNTEVFLKQCIDSLIGQTYQNLEIICVNDGSNDNTLHILYEYAEKDDRIIVVDQENTGLSGVRNKALSLSTGKYVTFVDSDDWLKLDYIERVLAEIKDEDVIVCGYIKASETQEEPVRLFSKVFRYDETNIGRLRQRVLGPIGEQTAHPENIDSLSSVCTKFIKKTIVDKNNLYFRYKNEVGPAEDMFFSVCYYQHANSALCLPIEGYYYRRNSASFTRCYNPQLLEQWDSLYSLLWKQVEDKPMLHEAYRNRKALSVIGLSLNQINVSKNLFRQRKKVKEILNHRLYKGVFFNFDISYMPIHWKIFFFLVKNRCYTSMALMLNLINRLR